MYRWLRNKVRKWRRARSTVPAGGLPASIGRVTLALFHPTGTADGPRIRTVFRNDVLYQGMKDVEIRGFLDGEVKFERNVATQYHVRIGCEGSKPMQGRYEVMRVLLRWDISSLPRYARVLEAQIVLSQEDTTRFPYRYPLRWPVDFYLLPVLRPWGAGRGGIGRDNQSRPEPGDAWWIESEAQKGVWRLPGCGYASDEHPDADRGATPLAWARIDSPHAELRFTGPRFTAHVERAASEGRSLDLIVKASAVDESLPGSIKSFFSGEFGDDLNPKLRPRLEVDWTAPCIGRDEWAFVIEPGGQSAAAPAFTAALPSDGQATLAASVRLDAASRKAGLLPEISVTGWRTAESRSGSEPLPLALPLHGSPGEGLRVCTSAAVHPVVAGQSISIRVLETWAPAARRPEDLAVVFRFTAPSRRSFDIRARYASDFQHVAEFRPDELGVWSYAWTTRPDNRFEVQRGQGHFTVVPGRGDAYVAVLRGMTEAAIEECSRLRAILARRRSHIRLVSLQRDIRAALAEPTPPGAAPGELRELLRRIAAVLPQVD